MKIWKLELMDGTSIEMPEAAAQMTKLAMGRGDKFISLQDRTVATHQIKTLDKTSVEDVAGKRLLGEGLNAFKGQIETVKDDKGYELVPALRVKKEVSQRDFTSYYSKHPSYKVESSSGGFAVSFTVAKAFGIPEGCELA